jgi:hypothetical protein
MTGDLAVLADPVAQELLKSSTPARLGYVWRDGTPRVVPIWFHWTGKDIVFGTPEKSPKVKALKTGSKVTISIDTVTWPYKVLQIRGTAHVETVPGVAPEYVSAAERYMGPEGGRAWVDQVRGMFPAMTRIAVTPEWANVLDFEQRFPSAIVAAMSGR